MALCGIGNLQDDWPNDVDVMGVDEELHAYSVKKSVA
jgi:hypothetical protein